MLSLHAARVRWLPALLLLASCGDSASSPGAQGGSALSDGAVELLASGSTWTTIGSFTGKAIPGHFWGAKKNEYEFRGDRGAFRKTASGFEFVAYGVNSTQQDDQNHLVRFSCDSQGNPQKAEVFTALITPYFPKGVRFLANGTIWMYRADDYSTGTTEVYHTTMDKPFPDVSPYYQRGQRLTINDRAAEVRVIVDGNENPWFVFQPRVYRAASPTDLGDPPGNGVAHNAYVCEQCTYFTSSAGTGKSETDAFLIGDKLYLPAWGEKTSASLAPNRLAIFTPQSTPAGTKNLTTGYVEDAVTMTADVALNFDDYSWFRSHVVGARAHLTWIGAKKASQLVFDPSNKSFTVRMKEIDVTGLDVTKVKSYRFDEQGDLYFLTQEGDGHVVKKLSPAGFAAIGGPIRFAPADAAPASAFERRVETMYVYDGKPLVVVVANGFPKVEPQLSLIVPR